MAPRALRPRLAAGSPPSVGRRGAARDPKTTTRMTAIAASLALSRPVMCCYTFWDVAAVALRSRQAGRLYLGCISRLAGRCSGWSSRGRQVE
jgi:hypothetical protein